MHVIRQFHPNKLGANCPPISFWNFSSAVALGPKVATARSASPVGRNPLFIETFLARIEAISAGYLP